MPLDEKFLYEPATMMAALEQNPAPKRYLMNTFFKDREKSDTEEVLIDVEKTARCMAGFTHPDHDGNVVEHDSYFTISVTPGYTREKMTTRASDLLRRFPGESIVGGMTPMQRAGKRLGKDLRILDDRLARLEEKSCADVLFTGKLHIQGPGVNRIVDFGYEDGEHIVTLSGSSMWDAGGDPIEDLIKYSDRVVERCGIAPTHAICGSRVAKVIRNHPKVLEKANILHVYVGEVKSQSVAPGVVRLGTFTDSQLDLYAYKEWYIDPVDKKSKPIVPPDCILLASTEARTTFHYGLIKNMHGLIPAERFPWSWITDDGRARYVQLESAPLPNIVQPDAFQVIRAVA